jgi:hypothetical protein
MLTLVHNDHYDRTAFNQFTMKSEFAQYFNVESYDADKKYNPKDTLVLTSYVDLNETWFAPLVEQGFKVVVDHLWDGDVDTPSAIDDNGYLVLRAPNWIWYYSAITWEYYGYHQYQPAKNIQHSFFMPMNRQEWHRDLVMQTLEPVLNTALYSYQAQGIPMLNDTAGDAVPWRIYANPDWYNTTAFSVVSESYMRTNSWVLDPTADDYRTEISEKSFKPIAFYHPFIVYGSEGTLRYLHLQGFETFPELFDESYDDILNDQDRFDQVNQAVISAVDRFKQAQFDVSLVNEKLKHNHARFFNLPMVKQRLRDEIVADVLEYAHT